MDFWLQVIFPRSSQLKVYKINELVLMSIILCAFECPRCLGLSCIDARINDAYWCWPSSSFIFNQWRPTEAETKWLPFRRQFQTHFHEWKVFYFDSNFTEFCSLGSNRPFFSIGSHNGLARNRHQAIVGLVHWHIYICICVSFILNKLTHWGLSKVKLTVNLH